MPCLADVGLDSNKSLTLLDGIYSTITVRNLLKPERRRGQRQITEPDLLRKVILFLANNIGNHTSITSISNTFAIVDMGLGNYLLGYGDIDTRQIIENIVCFESLCRGYDVHWQGGQQRS